MTQTFLPNPACAHKISLASDGIIGSSHEFHNVIDNCDTHSGSTEWRAARHDGAPAGMIET